MYNAMLYPASKWHPLPKTNPLTNVGGSFSAMHARQVPVLTPALKPLKRQVLAKQLRWTYQWLIASCAFVLAFILGSVHWDQPKVATSVPTSGFHGYNDGATQFRYLITRDVNITGDVYNDTLGLCYPEQISR